MIAVHSSMAGGWRIFVYVVLFMCCPGENWKHYARVLRIQCQALGKIQVNKAPSK